MKKKETRAFAFLRGLKGEKRRLRDVPSETGWRRFRDSNGEKPVRYRRRRGARESAGRINKEEIYSRKIPVNVGSPISSQLGRGQKQIVIWTGPGRPPVGPGCYPTR